MFNRLLSCRFYFICVLAGIMVGCLGALFRFLLSKLDALRSYFLDWTATQNAETSFVAIAVICISCAVIARYLVRPMKRAQGSGIQYIEAEWQGMVSPSNWRLIPIKFLGSLLSLGSGMALGREGPIVQMGATIGTYVSKWIGLTPEEVRFLTVASAGSGLGVAFSAPMGGILFTLEEVTKSFNTKLTLATFFCVSSGCFVSMTLLGNRPDYLVEYRFFNFPTLFLVGLYFALGIFTGLMGTLYNRLVLKLLTVQSHITSISIELRCVLLGLIVSMSLFFVPKWSGSGEILGAQVINDLIPLHLLLLIALFRWFFAPLCYSFGVPGGLFSPLIVMGCILGQLFGSVAELVYGGVDSTSFCIAGMASFFSATIGAPLTGIFLLLEMTVSWDLILPVTVASSSAFLTMKLLGTLPIYTSLQGRISSK